MKKYGVDVEVTMKLKTRVEVAGNFENEDDSMLDKLALLQVEGMSPDEMRAVSEDYEITNVIGVG
ncbi:hypothetical protein NSQ26_05875 [Bacillus sp. FSL W7-1360]